MNKKYFTYDDLIKYFHNSITPPSENKLGIEYEIFCFHKDSLKRLDYYSNPGIKNSIEYFVHQGFTPTYEGNILIGAESNDFYITLEPGGQFEASFAPCKTIREFEKLLNSYLFHLHEIEKSYPIIFVASGVDPISKPDEVPWMPKERYQIMQKYLANKGSLGHLMMKQSAAIQVNIDYNSEIDAVNKYNRVIDLYNPLMHLFSNSSIYENKIQDTLNFREIIWQNTDLKRCGITLGNKSITSFNDYINTALDIPMILICKNNRFIEITKHLTFNEFMAKGYESYDADINDWKLHLNMLYPHVRFNNKTLEIRLFDSQKPEILLAITAVTQALFYGEENNKEKLSAKDIVLESQKKLSPEERTYLKPLPTLLKKTSAESAREYFIQKKNVHDFIHTLKVL